MRVLVVLGVDSPLGLGPAGRGRQPAGSDDNEVGREDMVVSTMDVGRDEAGGVGGMVWNECRLFVLSMMRSSRTRRSPRKWARPCAAVPTTVAEEAVVDTEAFEAGDSGSKYVRAVSCDKELTDGAEDLCGVSSKTEKRRRAPGQERP